MTAFDIKDKIKIKYVILLGLLGFVLFNGSLLGLVHNRLELRKLEKQNRELDEEYTRLSAELERLEKGDVKYLEEVARTKYHMSKEGETEFRW